MGKPQGSGRIPGWVVPPLKDQYPILYNIVQHKEVSVHHVLQDAPPMNMSFRRALTGNKWEMWSHLVLRLLDITLTDVPDSFHWKLTNNGVFTVKSMYEDLMNGHTRFFTNLSLETEDSVENQGIYVVPP